MLRFTELRVWQIAHVWVLEVYRLSAQFPPEERFGLTAQLRRAAVAVAANIAEGSKRRTAADYARFVNIAEASLAEAEYYLVLTRDLGYGDVEGHMSAATQVAAMLSGLHRKLTADAGR